MWTKDVERVIQIPGSISCVVVEAPYGELTADMWQNCALCPKFKSNIILVFFHKEYYVGFSQIVCL